MSIFKSLNGNGLWAQRRLEILLAIARFGGRAETKAVFNAVSALDPFATKGPQEPEQKPPEDYFKNALWKATDMRFVEAVDGFLILTEFGRGEVTHAVNTTVTVAAEVALPEEVNAAELVEGAVRSITVNAYERNPEARRRCIEAHGTDCCICGFSFGVVYGKVAEGYTHVHHLRPLSEIGGEYKVDPVEDLRPVCPNCHAVLHLGGQCRSIDEVRQLLR